jgi:hypothetical protein
MKNVLLLISALMLSTSVVFAQDDGYHQYEKQTCNAETCLFVGDSEIGYTEYSDLDGNQVKSLNTDSSILDMDLSINNACFTGDNKEVEEILEALAGNTNSYYSQGGHSLVDSVAFAQSSASIVVAKIFYLSDYTTGMEVDYVVIKKCE